MKSVLLALAALGGLASCAVGSTPASDSLTRERDVAIRLERRMRNMFFS